MFFPFWLCKLGMASLNRTCCSSFINIYQGKSPLRILPFNQISRNWIVLIFFIFVVVYTTPATTRLFLASSQNHSMNQVLIDGCLLGCPFSLHSNFCVYFCALSNEAFLLFCLLCPFYLSFEYSCHYFGQQEPQLFKVLVSSN